MKTSNLTRTMTAALALASTPAAAANFFVGDARGPALQEVARLRPIQARAVANIMAQPGVIAFGIGLDRIAQRVVFKVTVDEQRAVPPLPLSLEGVPLLVELGEPVTPNSGGSACQPCHANQIALPVEMGNSGRPVAAGSTCGSCTMGFKACDEGTGQQVWVTAAHCSADATTCPGSAPLGSPAGHVSPGDSGTCSLASNVGAIAGQAPPTAGGTVDATSVDSAPDMTQTKVRDIGSVSATPGSALPGDEVRKSGRTTGLTSGVVDAINQTVNISYNCGTLQLTQQIEIDDATNDIFCTGGDSGSGLFTFDTPAVALGLIVAGSASGLTCYANDINNVLPALGLSMNFTACVEDTCPAIAVADDSNQPQRAKDLMYKLRDDVLVGSEKGKGWIRSFYSVAPAWLGVYTQNPNLMGSTITALQTNLDVLDAVANKRAIVVTKARLSAVTNLITQHINASQNAALDAALLVWKNEINTKATQTLFKVTVR